MKNNILSSLPDAFLTRIIFDLSFRRYFGKNCNKLNGVCQLNYLFRRGTLAPTGVETNMFAAVTLISVKTNADKEIDWVNTI